MPESCPLVTIAARSSNRLKEREKNFLGLLRQQNFLAEGLIYWIVQCFVNWLRYGYQSLMAQLANLQTYGTKGCVETEAQGLVPYSWNTLRERVHDVRFDFKITTQTEIAFPCVRENRNNGFVWTLCLRDL